MTTGLSLPTANHYIGALSCRARLVLLNLTNFNGLNHFDASMSDEAALIGAANPKYMNGDKR
jgi:hypothetical protein